MGLFQVAVVALFVWCWQWCVLNTEDHSDDVLIGGEPGGGTNQVWTRPQSAEALVKGWYDRALDPRRPTALLFDVHPVGKLQPGEGQGDRERVDARWWWAHEGLNPVWTDGDPATDPPDYITLRGESVPTPEKLQDDLLKKRWKEFQRKVSDEQT